MDSYYDKVTWSILPGIFPQEWGTQCPVKKVFFKGRGLFFKEPVLTGVVTFLYRTAFKPGDDLKCEEGKQLKRLLDLHHFFFAHS